MFVVYECRTFSVGNINQFQNCCVIFFCFDLKCFDVGTCDVNSSVGQVSFMRIAHFECRLRVIFLFRFVRFFMLVCKRTCTFSRTSIVCPFSFCM